MLIDILEMEFQLGYALNILPNFNSLEFYEFVWIFERMVEQRKKENEASQKNQDGNNRNRPMTDLMNERQ